MLDATTQVNSVFVFLHAVFAHASVGGALGRSSVPYVGLET